MAEIDALSYVLGFLDEYMGRGPFLRPPDYSAPDEEFVPYVPDESIVERFYPDERAKSELFAAWLRRLASERGISAVVESETLESGHIVIRCHPLAEIINQCYRVRKDFASGDELYVSADMFPEGGMTERLSFLAGAYARYGAGNQFTFTNASHKSELAVQFLVEAGCSHVTLTSNPDGYIPLINTVSFDPTPEFAGWILR